MKWQAHLWTGGSLLVFALFFLLIPTYASFFSLPYLVALSFRTLEMRALIYSALIGALLDVNSELFPFGFFSITLPALTAFLYSLEHFFQKGRLLAMTCTFTLTLIMALIQILWIAIGGLSSWVDTVSRPAFCGIFTSLLTMNSLITWSLFHRQEKSDQLKSKP